MGVSETVERDQVTETPPRRRAEHRGGATSSGIPMWVTVLVILVLTALFAWNIIVYGPDGLGNSYVIGGLLGAYSGIDHLVRQRRRRESGYGDPNGEDPPTSE